MYLAVLSLTCFLHIHFVVAILQAKQYRYQQEVHFELLTREKECDSSIISETNVLKTPLCLSILL